MNNRRKIKNRNSILYPITGLMISFLFVNHNTSVRYVGATIFVILTAIAYFININFIKIISFLTRESTKKIKSNYKFLSNYDYNFSEIIYTIFFFLSLSFTSIYAYIVSTEDYLSITFDLSINFISILSSLVFIEIYYSRYINKVKKDITHGKTSLFNYKQRRLRSKRNL